VSGEAVRTNEDARERVRSAIHTQKEWLERNPGATRAIIRAKVSMDHDFRKEAVTRHFRFVADEPVSVGGEDLAPQPMEYFIAGIGF